MSSYPGGKGGSGVMQTIINQIPPHKVYIEAFLGSGVIMRTKRPAEKSFGIDSDPDVIARWYGGDLTLPPGGIAFVGDAAVDLRWRTWHGNEFVYCDPPYLFDVRSSKRPIYAHEFGEPEDHGHLLDTLLGLPCMVMISGYWSELYADKLAGWRTTTFQTIDRGSNVKTEWLWMNYPEPVELHDYRFLGKNFRERERLKRIRNTWVAKLGRMNTLERLMLSAAIAESGEAAGRSSTSQD